MGFDIDTKIQELKEKLESIKKESEENRMEPKWWHLLREFYFKSKLKQLEAIRDKRFHVTISLHIDCETFGSKEFSVDEFDLTDENTVKCAIHDFRKYEDGKKDSLFT